MLKKFDRQQKDFIGVEFDDVYFKIAHAVKRSGGMKILKTEAILDKNISEDDISAHIYKFIKDNKIKSPDILNIIPSRFGIFKNIEIPSIDPLEIKQIIDLQAGAHTPYSKNDIIVSYKNIGTIHEKYSKIFLVIVKKEIITKRTEVLKKVGFSAERSILSSEPLTISTIGILSPEKRKGIKAIVNLDNSFSDFTVTKEGDLLYVRSIPSGIKDLTGTGESGVERFCEEIKRSLDAYQANNIDEGPEDLLLVGDNKITGKVSDNYARIYEGSIKCESIDVSAGGLWESKEVFKGPEDLSFFSVIAPLMAPEKDYIDLTPEDVIVGREIKKRSREALKLGILSMAAILFFCLILITDLTMQKVYLDQLERSYVSENREVEKLNEVIEATSVVRRFVGEKGVGLSGMAKLFQSVPPEMYLTSIDFQGGDTFTFTGTAETMSGVFSFVTELEGSPGFSNVNVDFTRSRKQRDKEVADFGLTLKFKKEII